MWSFPAVVIVVVLILALITNKLIKKTGREYQEQKLKDAAQKVTPAVNYLCSLPPRTKGGPPR